MQSTEGTECSMLNVHLHVREERDMLLPDTTFVVILEGDQEFMIVALLDRTYISKLPAQVGNWQEL